MCEMRNKNGSEKIYYNGIVRSRMDQRCIAWLAPDQLKNSLTFCGWQQQVA